MNKIALSFILILLLCMPLVAGGEGPRITINASRQNISYGDKLVFSGASNGFTVYFFMTGPGLDPAGVMTFNTTKSARTRGHVAAMPQNGVWHWGWKTGNVTGPLPDGNYTIYACNSPVNTEELSSCTSCVCSSMNVTLTGSPTSRVAETIPPEQANNTANVTLQDPPVSSLPGNESTMPAPTLSAPSFCLLAGMAAAIAGLIVIRRHG
jgi:hypothetical protein